MCTPVQDTEEHLHGAIPSFPQEKTCPVSGTPCKAETPGNALPSLLLAARQSFMLYAYIPLRNALQTSLGVCRTDLLWEMPQPTGWAALAIE